MQDPIVSDISHSSSDHTPRYRKFILQRIAESEQAAQLFTNKRLSVLVFEVPLIIIMIITILAGVCTALGLLLGLQLSDNQTLRMGQKHEQLVLRELDRMQSYAQTGSSLFDIAQSVSLQQFNKFVVHNDLPIDYVIDVSFVQYVRDEDKAAYILDARTKYSSVDTAYASFNIFAIYLRFKSHGTHRKSMFFSQSHKPGGPASSSHARLPSDGNLQSTVPPIALPVIQDPIV